MLPVSELVRVARTLDGNGSSPLALRVGEPWGVERVRFVRSSANHVFFCSGAHGETVLRFRPAAPRALTETQWVAELSNRVAAAGGRVAQALPDRDGAFASELDLDGERFVASMVAQVEGPELEADSLPEEQARRWGRGLARLHEQATGLDPAPALQRWSDWVEGDADVAAALARLPTTRRSFGVVHGDPELDNVVWVEGEPVFVDLDDAARSWFAADVAFALRDFAPRGGAPDVSSPLVAAFLGGYRDVRALSDEELEWLPLFGRAHALVTLARLRDTLAEPVDPEWPEWAIALRSRLERIAGELRAAVA